MSDGRASVPEVNPWLVAVSVMFGTFMEVLDTTVVNVSLPHIAGSLSATVDESTWALTSYLAANAIILPITGWLANQFGRKRLLMASLAGFTISSVCCGLAVSLPMLVLFRTVQGMTGGVMQPVSQAVLLEAFPPKDRGKAMGFWGVGIVVAPILGPVLGGWLTDHYSWRWVFYINVPVGIVSLVMTWLFIFDPEYIRRTATKIDTWGLGLLAVGIGALQVTLDRGQEADWFSSRWITFLMILAVGCLVGLVVRELLARHPVIDLSVFRKRTYTSGVILMSVLGFGLYGSVVIIAIQLQTLMGYPPYAAGITMAPRGIGSLLAMPIVGFLTAKIDPRKLLAAGFLLAATTLLWLGSLSLQAGYWDLFWPQFCQGISLGLLFVPLTTVTMDPISRERMGNATSLFNLTRNIGGSMGIAIVQTLIARWRQVNTHQLVAHVTPFDPATRRTLGALRAGFAAQGADPATASQRALAALWGLLQQQAGILSFLHAFRFLGVLFLAVSPMILLMRKPRHDADEPGAVMH